MFNYPVNVSFPVLGKTTHLLYCDESLDSPPSPKKPKTERAALTALSPSNDPAPSGDLVRNFDLIKQADIRNGYWHYNGDAHPLVFLGEGKDHVVWGFGTSGSIIVQTTDGGKDIPLDLVIIKSPIPSKIGKPRSIVRQLNEDRNTRALVEANFRLINEKSPMARLFVTSFEMVDPLNPKNGVEIWERCDPLVAADPALWLWASHLLKESVRFGLEHGKELIGSFRPPNVMRNADQEFVLVDASTGKDAEPFWQQRVARYVREWCEFCGKTEKELTQDWPAECKDALTVTCDDFSSDNELVEPLSPLHLIPIE